MSSAVRLAWLQHSPAGASNREIGDRKCHRFDLVKRGAALWVEPDQCPVQSTLERLGNQPRRNVGECASGDPRISEALGDLA